MMYPFVFIVNIGFAEVDQLSIMFLTGYLNPQHNNSNRNFEKEKVGRVY